MGKVKKEIIDNGISWQLERKIYQTFMRGFTASVIADLMNVNEEQVEQAIRNEIKRQEKKLIREALT